MDFFTNARTARTVRLRSHLDKYLYADEDEEKVRQSSQGSTCNVKWEVEYVEGDNHVIRLKSCYGRYLTATDSSYPTGMIGKKVIQKVSNKVLDLSLINWEPIRDRHQVKFMISGGKYLCANGGPLPWRNTVTHDVPNRTMTQEWILWIVDVIDETGSFAGSPSAATSSIPAAQTVSVNDSSRTTSSVSMASVKSSSRLFTSSMYRSFANSIKSTPRLTSSSSSSERQLSDDAFVRKIYYQIDGVDDDEDDWYSFVFKGSTVEELTEKLREKTKLENISVCLRSVIDDQLYPLRRHLPGSNSEMHVVVVVHQTSPKGNSVDNHNHNGWGPSSTVSPVPPSKATTSGWLDNPAEDACNGWTVIETGSSSNQAPNNSRAAVSVTSEIPETVNFSTPIVDDNKSAGKGAVKDDVACVICLDAPVEGACVPCGHMAGCMSCLKEIKAKKWGCPVCRAKIDQLIRIYTV